MELQLLTQRLVQFNWINPTHETNVTIKIPQLNEDKCISSGDWGTNYSCEVPSNNPIEITYSNHFQNQTEHFALDENFIFIQSPLLADVRKEMPFYYVVKDKEHGILYEVYLCNKFDVKKVKIIRLSDGVNLYTQNM